MTTGRYILTGVAAAMLCFPMKAQPSLQSDSIRTRDIAEVQISADRSYGAGSVSTEKKADARLAGAAGALQVSDVIKYFSGATVKDYGGIGGLKTVSVRGLGASHTAVAYNGIMITDSQTGQIDLGRFSAGQAESVRMVSGPDNDMLQTAAMAAQAAAVNLESRRPNLEGKAFKGTARLLSGSFGTIGAQADADFRTSGSSIATASVEWLQSDGDYPYIQDNGASSKLMKRINSDVSRLRTEAALTGSRGQTSYTVRAYWFQSQQGLPANILYRENAASERLWNRNGFVQSSLRTLLSPKLTLQANAKYGISRTRYLNPNVNSSSGKTDNRYHEQEYYLSGVLMYSICSRLSASAASDCSYATLGGVSANPTRLTLNSSAAVKFASERIVLTGRLNHVVAADHTADSGSDEGDSRLSPVIGANWLVWPALGLHVRASVQNTFRLPTFNDLYFEQIGRRDLRPERATVKSGGIALEKELQRTAVSFYADAFDSRVRDRILAVPGKNTAVWMMKNVGLVTTHGLETGLGLEFDLQPCTAGLNVSYTCQRAMDKSQEGSPTWNHQLPYTPRHSASGVAFFETPFVSASCSFIYSGSYYSNAYNGPQYAMPSYYEAGCCVWKHFSLKHTELNVKAECINLTDSRYELVSNYPMPGRQWRLTASIEL